MLNAISYDGYNQSASEESCYPLRTMNGSEGDDRTPKVAVKQSFGINPQAGGMNPLDHELGETQAVCHMGGVMQVNENDLLKMRYIVRRLTPTEAERLMGLPDGWTIPMGLRRYFGADGEPSPELVDEFVERFDTFNAIMAAYEHKAPPKGKSRKQVAEWLKKISCAETCPDSPRYKGCGNSWASNQPRWILTRLLAIGEGIDPYTGETL